MSHSNKNKASKNRAMKKKAFKKCRATVPRTEPQLREMESFYRAMVAWVRHLHLPAALLHAFTRAGAMAGRVAAIIMNRSTSPPPTDAHNGAPPPSDATNLSSGAHTSGSASAPTGANKSSGSASAPASKSCDSSAPTGANNSGSQASSSASAPASKPYDSSAPTGANNSSGSAPAPASKSCNSSAPTGAKNSGLQTSSSASAPASKFCDWSAPPGAKNSGSQASSSGPGPASAPRLAAKRAKQAKRAQGFNKKDPFSDGYHLNSLFEEEQCLVIEEDALIYARFCSERKKALLNTRGKEMCHICYFEYGKVSPYKKHEEHHCQAGVHKIGAFLCKKEGCFIRTSSLKDVGRHHYFCHEKYRGWWVDCLKMHGEM